MNPLLLRWTRFATASPETGAEKRSAQIRALCERAGLAIAEMPPPPPVSRWRAWPAGARARWQLGPHASVDRAGIGLLGYRALFYREALARHSGARILLWETTYDSLLPAMAKAAGYRIIALPHNLESLVSEAVFRDARYDPAADLAAEMRRLARADAIFTIAREERWLLETRGLTPHYLPFYPDPLHAVEWSRIRERRQARIQGNGHVPGPLLILGSAFNPATARGMRLQLAWLAAGGLPAQGVVVAGNHTDKILGPDLPAGVELRGRVSSDALADLFGRCSALLIHTEGGAGAVTRIPEALAAGVPVIANGNAARDQFGTPGVHVYESQSDFRALIARPLPLPPLPPEPRAAQERFLTTIRQFLAERAPTPISPSP